MAMLLSHGVRGQSATASLRGVVVDSTNAVVPGAEVVISSIDTALVWRERSNSRGEFSFQELPVADYRVAVSDAGFPTWVNTRIHLDVGSQSQIVVRLVPASSEQTVEISAETAHLHHIADPQLSTPLGDERCWLHARRIVILKSSQDA